MAFVINGKADRLLRKDFTQAARTMGIAAATANELISGMLSTLRTAIDAVDPPAVLVLETEASAAAVARALEICRLRCAQMS